MPHLNRKMMSLNRPKLIIAMLIILIGLLACGYCAADFNIFSDAEYCIEVFLTEGTTGD